MTAPQALFNRALARCKVHWLLFREFVDGAKSLSSKEWRLLIALAILGPPYILLKKLTHRKK